MTSSKWLLLNISLKNAAPCVCDRSEQKGQKVRDLNLEALLEPCKLLLLRYSLNTSKEAINKILILVDEAEFLESLRLFR